ncbi:hypothetical protein [Fredinandcohnia sp. 179-A 10B2 NHS]|uniref:hypothetical protein n=1 Tax=Fredinandcohnia sp. 179-A 10B2 NHS TaxID=3235176 RepID=UPI0039A27191
MNIIKTERVIRVFVIFIIFWNYFDLMILALLPNIGDIAYVGIPLYKIPLLLICAMISPYIMRGFAEAFNEMIEDLAEEVENPILVRNVLLGFVILAFYYFVPVILIERFIPFLKEFAPLYQVLAATNSIFIARWYFTSLLPVLDGKRLEKS